MRSLHAPVCLSAPFEHSAEELAPHRQLVRNLSVSCEQWVSSTHWCRSLHSACTGMPFLGPACTTTSLPSMSLATRQGLKRSATPPDGLPSAVSRWNITHFDISH